MHDVVIRNAQLVDGLGGPPRHGSLAVAAGRIAAVGDDVGPGRQILDARELTLAPGIIDTHTHYDAQVTWDPGLTASSSLGVTTAIMGNCGFTIAPCRSGDRDLVMRNLTNVEGMSLDALRAGIRWEFETVPEYLAMIERRGIGLNLAAFVGHSSIRTFVMREDAPRRPARADEVDAMRTLVLEGVRAGATGFATSTAPAHNGHGGLPMPSRLADDAELLALTGALGDAARGMFMLTKGAQTTMDFTLETPYPFEGLESWRPALGQQGEAFKRAIADPGFRNAIRAELAQPVTVRAFNGEWDKVIVAETALPAHRALEGRSLAEVGREERRDPLDVLLDVSLAEDLRTAFAALLLNSDETAVARLLRHPHSLVSLSDAGAHLTLLNDAGFGLHLLGYWVRERGVLSLAEAVRKLTADAAAAFGITDRGRLAVGCAADLMLFDPATVARGPKRRVFDLPAGASRLAMPAIGLHGVWVNGEQVADERGPIPSAPLAGRLLREFAA